MTPAFGLALLAAALLVGQALWRSQRELARWLGEDPFARRRVARAALLVGAAGLVAWAALQAVAIPPRLHAAGTDVVLAVDVSRSMNVRDVRPSRLRRALRLAETVSWEAEGVRLALVVFAGDAYVALPLTQDRDALVTYLRALDSEVISRPGTDLARALDAAARVFDPRSSRPRRVLLLSDGEHAGGDLESALARLRTLGVRVLPVGFGTPEGGPVPAPGGTLRDPSGRSVHSRRADAVLRRVADATDGAYLREREDNPTASRLLPEQALLGERRAEETPPPALRRIEGAVALAVVLLALELALSSGRLRGPRPRRGLAGATAGIALSLVAVGPSSWQREGDALLERGSAREALSLYRRVERHAGHTPRTRIRIGNAQFRLGQNDQAASAYLSALRLAARDAEARFVAAFNLGSVLLEQERFREARDALWSALLEDPESLEAQFNYEWALARLPPEPDVPVPPTPSAPEEEEEPTTTEPQPAPGPEQRERASAELSEAEAERWLQSIVESPDEPLRRQVAEALEQGRERSAPGGQTW